MFKNKPIFIGCMPKSGASLLRSLIGNHPNIFGGDGFETNWFADEMKNHWKESDTERHKWLIEWFNVSAEENELIKLKSNSGIEYFNYFMEYCTKRQNKKRWLEKTPKNIEHYNLIRDVWPESKFILSIRDLRDVFASWKAKAGSNLKNYDVFEFVNMCKSSFTNYENLFSTQSKYYIDVKYEDTVLRTKETLLRVYDFLDEEWVEGSQFHKPSGELEKVQRIIGKGSTTSESLEKPIFNTSIGQWEKILTNEELKIINDELGLYQSLMGYPLD